MKNSITYFIFILVLLIGQGCSQKPFPLDDPSPAVFKINGEIDGQPIGFEAGTNGYYLFTDVTHLYNEQWSLSGKMAPADCPACGPSLEFRLFGNANGPAEPVDIDDLLQEGSQQFVTGESNYLNILDISEIFDAVGSPFIAVNGNDVSNDMVAINSNDEWVDIQYFDFVDFPVCQTQLTFKRDLTQCDVDESIITTFDLTYQDGFATVRAPSFIAEQGEVTAWYLGIDTTVPTFITVGDEPFTFEMEDAEATTIMATRANEPFEDLTYFCIQTIFDQFSGACPERSVTLLTVPQNVEQQFEIRYTDEDGELYTTTGSCNENFTQPATSSLTVSQIEEYITDIHGNPTKSFQVVGDFQLQNVHSPLDILQLSNLNAKIALGYPAQ